MKELKLNFFFWKGKYHRLPENFIFPEGVLLQLWQHWCCGNESLNFPPLSRIESNNLSSNNNERLSDLQFLISNSKQLSLIFMILLISMNIFNLV